MIRLSGNTYPFHLPRSIRRADESEANRSVPSNHGSSRITTIYPRDEDELLGVLHRGVAGVYPALEPLHVVSQVLTFRK